MKELLKTALLAVVLSAFVAGCRQRPSANAVDAGSADSLVVEVDSMAVALTLRVYALPADTLLQRSFAQLVCQSLFFDEDDVDAAPARPVFGGDLPAYVEACARQKWDELRDATFGTADEAADDGEGLTLEELAAEAVKEQVSLTAFEMVYRQVYETDSLVSWTCNYDFFVHNTAHPSFGGYGLTVRKSDGQPLGHEILERTDSQGFRQLLKEGLRRWIADVLEEQATTDQQLQKYLFSPETDPNALPLPEQRPYLTSEGVVLPYREDELVFCREPALIVLPFNQVLPYLAPVCRP